METPAIRERMLGHLQNIHLELAENVARGLGIKHLPTPPEAAVATRENLDPSPALSIIENGPKRFEGRARAAAVDSAKQARASGREVVVRLLRTDGKVIELDRDSGLEVT